MNLNSLRVRTTLALVTAVLASLLVTAVLLVLSAWNDERRDIETRGENFASLTTGPISVAYETYYRSGYFKFRELIRDFLRRSPDVKSVLLVDVTGVVLFDSSRLEEGGPRARDTTPRMLDDPAHLEAAALLQPRFSRRQDGGFDIVSPFVEDWGRHRYSVIYRFGYDSLTPRLVRQAYITGGLALAALLVAWLFGLALMARITRPLEQLTASARGIAAGRFDQSLEVRSGDELQVLAEAFNQMARDLEESVHQHEASNRTLAETNAELEARNAELERFTYTVSHDLKSPLITIRGFLGFVESHARSGDMEGLHGDVERISMATTRMQRLLDELLNLSRVGRITNAPEDVPLRETVDEAVALTRGRFDERGISVEIADDLPMVRADRPRLVEVLQNLLDNAAKFSRGEGARVRVGHRIDDGEVVIFVADDGVGIDPRYHDKVFDLFDKLDASSEGTGVGLALVKRIIEVHGGRVWVESQGEGSGTMMCFTLAAATTEPETPTA